MPRMCGRESFHNHRLTAANISIDPAVLVRSTSWVFGSIDTAAAGQLTVIFAIDVVTVGGARYLMVAAKTAPGGAEPLRLPVWSPSLVNQSVSGIATIAQWPCKLDH